MINLLKKAQSLFVEDGSKAKTFVVDSLSGTILETLKLYNKADCNILIYAANNYDANNVYNK